jgi:hypothetical protein
MSEIYELGLDIIYAYIYQGKTIVFEELPNDIINYIEGFRPRLPSDEFPEYYPDENGYTGDYFTLYRGLCFRSKKQYDDFKQSIRNGDITLNSVSSWTLNPSVAERFSKGAGLQEQENVPLYKGLILEISLIKKEETFFSAYEAHSELEYTFGDRLQDRDNTKLHSLHEEEIVILPGTYKVKIIKETILDEKPIV